jgi:glycosyltransferase involved in cell wall biosynthesis
MHLISVVTPCFNEEENVRDLYLEVKRIFSELKSYQYEHIFIDNSSVDKTVSILKEIAQTDKNVKIIVNSRNFGWIRSPFHGLLQARGDAAIYLSADFQDPPSLIPQFIKKWEEGFKIVVGVKPKSDESSLLFFIRKTYYKFVKMISELKLVNNFTGFGLYDQRIVEIMRSFGDAYPYFRGMISEIGFEIAEIEFRQPVRQRGLSTRSFYRLYDVAMLGITHHSKLPLRLMTMGGFALSLISLSLSIVYIVLKLIFWKTFPMGMAPMLIGLFFFSSLQMFFIGLLGEYIASIHTQILKRPLVIEKERINFEYVKSEDMRKVLHDA